MTSPASSVDKDGKDERVRTWAAGGTWIGGCDEDEAEEADDEASVASVWEGEGSDAAKDVARCCPCCCCSRCCCWPTPSDILVLVVPACRPDDDIPASVPERSCREVILLRYAWPILEEGGRSYYQTVDARDVKFRFSLCPPKINRRQRQERISQALARLAQCRVDAAPNSTPGGRESAPRNAAALRCNVQGWDPLLRLANLRLSNITFRSGVTGTVTRRAVGVPNSEAKIRHKRLSTRRNCQGTRAS